MTTDKLAKLPVLLFYDLKRGATLQAYNENERLIRLGLIHYNHFYNHGAQENGLSLAILS